ncbi:DUF4328 domain-containing protein [Haloferula sargassicola]|uniref:DUF4328 domain-containing protein n=1 Tax=Haloferula sargassicola TaxID=490096 RepID=UPI00336545DE
MDHHDPFLPPASSLDIAGQVADLPAGPYGPFRENRALAKAVMAMVFLFSFLVPLLTGALNIAIYAGHPFATSPPALAYLDLLAFVAFPVVATYFVFGIWIIRSAKNAHLFTMIRRKAAVGTPDNPPMMRDTPGWSVGWYFVPIASLWKPYQAMKDIFTASATRPAPDYLLPTWWTLWILALFTGNAVNAANSSDSFTTAATITVISTAINLGIALIAIQLVRTLTRMQADAAADLTTVWQAIPPAPVPGPVAEMKAMSEPQY